MHLVNLRHHNYQSFSASLSQDLVPPKSNKPDSWASCCRMRNVPLATVPDNCLVLGERKYFPFTASVSAVRMGSRIMQASEICFSWNTQFSILTKVPALDILKTVELRKYGFVLVDNSFLFEQILMFWLKYVVKNCPVTLKGTVILYFSNTVSLASSLLFIFFSQSI